MSAFSHILIRASAGTGKTFRLSNRYLELLYRDVLPDQILATTFTRKAAGEILDRVVVRLAGAALQPDALSRLSRELQITDLSHEQCLNLLRRLLTHLHRLRVCTLDAFFAQLAGSFSLELGLPPGWRIVEELQDRYLRREAIAMTLQGDGNHETQRLVHLMAKGEATRSISQLIQATVDDLYHLYLEAEPTAWQCIPRPPLLKSEELVATIEALRAAPLPDDKRATGARDNDLVAAEQGDWERFIGRGLASKILAGERTYYRKEIPDETIDLYQRLLQHARGVLLHQMADQTEATYQLLDKFHVAYAHLKQKSRALRFDDITRALSLGLAAGNSAAGNIEQQQYRLDTAVHHLLLDEFQDTSLAQWFVLRPFARQITSADLTNARQARGCPPSFFCVGDVKQAIYGWRGGLSEIFDALQNELPGLADESMNTSYRSSQPVIDTVNRVFAHMTRHTNLGKLEPGVSQWCHGFEEHTTAQRDLTGYVELCATCESNDEQGKIGAKIQHVACRIAELVQAASGCSVGVLVRSNKVVAHIIYELRQLGVPASEEGGNPLTDSPAVQIILSLLKLADHPGDTVARYHVARSPLGAQIKYTDHTRLEDTLKLAHDIRCRLLHHGYGPPILQWADQLAPFCDRRDRNRLQQLVELAYRYQQIATLRTTDFLLYVESQRVADPTTAEVRVMTVHQAKGLQFDIVVLPDLDFLLTGQADSCVVGQPSPTEPVDRICLYRNTGFQALLPPDLQQLFETATSRDVNEALCVLYVALTRAVHALYMFVAPSAANEKNLHKTPAGLLRAALTDGQCLAPRAVAYQCGDPHWYTRRPAKPATAPRQLKQDKPVRLAPSVATVQLEHTAPSQLEGGTKVSASRLLELDSAVATSRGTLIHALFEQVQWLDESPPAPEQLLRVAQRLASGQLGVDDQLAAFHRMLGLPEISAVLRREFYQSPRDAVLQRVLGPDLVQKKMSPQVHNERRFAVRDDQRLMSGLIDRLVLLYDNNHLVAAEVLDYKTDSASADDPAQVERLVAYYRPQLDAYRRAVSIMFRLPIERVSARLLFVGPGIVRAW